MCSTRNCYSDIEVTGNNKLVLEKVIYISDTRPVKKSKAQKRTCKAQNRMRDMGLKSLKHTFSQPGVKVLQTNFPCSSPKTVSAIETTIKKRSTKKNVTQNFPTRVECSAVCSRSFSTICHAISACDFVKLLLFPAEFQRCFF